MAPDERRAESKASAAYVAQQAEFLLRFTRRSRLMYIVSAKFSNRFQRFSLIVAIAGLVASLRPVYPLPDLSMSCRPYPRPLPGTTRRSAAYWNNTFSFRDANHC